MKNKDHWAKDIDDILFVRNSNTLISEPPKAPFTAHCDLEDSRAYNVAILVWTHNTHDVYIFIQRLPPRNSIDAQFSHQYLKPQINIKNQVYTFAKHTPTTNHHRLLVTIRCICFISGIFCANGKVGQMSY